MGFIKRTLSTVLLITFPIKIVIWVLAILCLFCVIAIKGLITNDNFYYKTLLQQELEAKHDKFLTKNCTEKGFNACLLSSVSFSDDGKNLITSYAKTFNNLPKPDKSPSDLKIKGQKDVDFEKAKQGNLKILKSIKKGCVQLNESANALLDYFDLKQSMPQQDTQYNWVYLCFKKDSYLAFFTKGKPCETCTVELSDYFNARSYSMFYGYKNGFFDRTARFTFDFVNTFFSQRIKSIKLGITNIVLSTAKYITSKLPKDVDSPNTEDLTTKPQAKTPTKIDAKDGKQPSLKDDFESVYDDSMPPEND